MLNFIVSVVLALLSLSAATHALTTKSDSRSALAWVSFCLLMPLAGPLAYLLFGINRARSTAQRLYAVQPGNDEAESAPLQSEFARAMIGERGSGKHLAGCTSVRFLENGDELFPAMLADIHAATNSVYLCTYIFQHDQIGRQFISSLVAAQSRGVDIKVLIDGLGELAYPPRAGKALHAAGLHFAHFDPIRLFPPSLHINLRNHRKMLIVDQKIAYTGGHNISAKHLVKDPAIRSPARDLHVRLEGTIVSDFGRAFAADWERVTGETLENHLVASAVSPSSDKAQARLILDGPNEDIDKLSDVLLGIFSSAKERLWLITPYFLPDKDLVGALTAARLRGVDVRVFIPERGNVHLAHWASQHSIQRLVADGLCLYLIPAPFIHSKALLIDDDYSLIGSANIDPRSLRLNFELGLELFSLESNAWLARYFLSLVEEAHWVDPSAPEMRPYLVRLRDALAWLFSPYL